MRLSSRLLIIMSAIASSALLLACGGGDSEETPTARPAATSTAVSPSGSPQATASVAPAATVPTGSGSVLDTTTQPPYELDNIRYGGTMVAPTQFSNALDPKFNNSGIGFDVRLAYESLVVWKAVVGQEYNQLTPQLAEKWTVSEDLKTYTFNLRKGVKFHNIAPVNGREFVADDVLFSMNRYREKDAVSYSNYLQIDSIETPDKYTVVLRLKDPNAFALNELFSNLDYVVPKELVASGEIISKAVGTGPMVMTKWNLRQGSSHVKNKEYWQKDVKGNQLPYLDAVEVPFITDPGTSMAAFRSGQTDLPAVGPNTDQLIILGKGGNVRIFSTGTSITGQGFAFRTDKAPWNDIRVRRAINMMLDKAKYGDQIEGIGRWNYSGPMPWSLVSDQPFKFDDYGPYYKFDPAAAKKLLIEAGFADGKIKSPTSLMAAQGNPYGPRTALFQSMFKEQGFEFDLQATDFATYNPYYFNRQAPDIALTHHIFGQPNLNWFAANKYHPDAAQNTSRVNDPEINKLLTTVKVTLDTAKQREIARKIWDFDTQGSFNIWVPIARSYTVMSARLRNHTARIGGQQTAAIKFDWLADAPRTAP